jgi:DNA-binding winged helix-turn-helix (wHTH) protein
MADILTTERLTFKFRLLAVLAVGLASFVAGAGSDPGKIVLISLIYLIYAFALHFLLPRQPHPMTVYPMILVDALFIALVMRWIGEAASLVIILFPLMVPFYAVYGAYATSFVAATLMLVVFAWTQHGDGRPAVNAALMTQIPLYYLLAALSGYLAQGRIRRLEEQEALQRLVRLENEARSLSGAVRTIQESSDLALMLQEMAEISPTLTGLPECLIGLLDRKSGALVTRAATTDAARLGVDRLDYLVEWPSEGSLTDEVMGLHEPIALRGDAADDGRLPLWALKLGARAILAVPLTSRGVDAGVMFFHGVAEGHAFSADEVNRAQAFADVVALVAVNAQLYEDVQVTIASVMSDLRPVVLPKPTPRQRRLSVIEVGDLVVDIPKREAKIAGKLVNLTPTEFDLLAVLAESSGHAVDQETLLRRVWGEDYNGRSTVVDVCVHRLRRKIEEGQGAPRRIITVRGSGYMLVPVSAISRQGA